MSCLTEQQIETIKELTHSTLKSQLSFAVSFRVNDYLLEDARVNWRAVRDRLYNEYPVKGIGLKATPSNLSQFDENLGGFLHLEEDLSPEDASDDLTLFPYVAASAAYAFTLLEGYGNQLADIVNPGYLKERSSWHQAVRGDANLRNASELQKAKVGFTKPFNRESTDPELYVIQRLVDLKYERNGFMHDAETRINFDEFHKKILGTIAALYFLVLPSETELMEYPYYDFHEKWK